MVDRQCRPVTQQVRFDLTRAGCVHGNGVAGFLATLDTAVQSALLHHPAHTLKPGDAIITNTPYEGGGTHLSDVLIIVPIHHAGELVGFSAPPGAVRPCGVCFYRGQSDCLCGRRFARDQG